MGKNERIALLNSSNSWTFMCSKAWLKKLPAKRSLASFNRRNVTSQTVGEAPVASVPNFQRELGPKHRLFIAPNVAKLED